MCMRVCMRACVHSWCVCECLCVSVHVYVAMCIVSMYACTRNSSIAGIKCQFGIFLKYFITPNSIILFNYLNMDVNFLVSTALLFIQTAK